MTDKKLKTSKEFRELVGISRPTEHRLFTHGKISRFKIGTRVFYSEKHIEEFLARNEQIAKTEKQAA